MSTPLVDPSKNKNASTRAGSQPLPRRNKRQLSSNRRSHIPALMAADGNSSSLLLPTTYSFKGQHDSYRIIYDVDRKMAKEIFDQTQLEVPIPLGQESHRHYVVGSGGFGDFCLGFAKNSGRYVGIKIPKESSTPDNIKKELALYQEIRNKSFRHILPIMDSFQVPDSQGVKLYQVMSLAGLRSVEQLKRQLELIRDKQFKEQILFCLAEGLLSGLAEMHSAGFYHLDMKPANLVIKGEGDVFLIDFGSSAQSKNGVIQEAESGDVDYYSKERWLEVACGIEFAGAPADAWAAGITLLTLWDNQYSHESLEILGNELLDELEAAEQQGRLLDSKNVSERFEQAASLLFSYLKNAAPRSIESLISDLLHPDAGKRLTPEAALHHPWFQKMEATASDWRKSVKERLREFIQALQQEQQQNKQGSLSPQDLPLPHFSSFVERPALQAKVVQSLLANPATICQGMGGVGKTQLALFILYKKEIQEHFGIKLWFRHGDNPSLLETEFVNVAQEFGLIQVQGKIDMKEVIEKLHRHLLTNTEKTGKPCLLVFDNAETSDALLPYLPPKGGHCLITTRNPEWKEAIPISEMTQEEAQTLVKKLLPKMDAEADILNFCKTLGYLPLGLRQASAYIAAESLTISVYLERLTKETDALSLLLHDERSFGQKLPNSILGMWQITFQTLENEHPNAYALLKSLSYLAADIPKRVLNAFASEEVQSILERYALLQHTKVGVRTLHRLLQLAVRAKEAKEEKELVEILIQNMNILNGLFEDSGSLIARQNNLLLLPQTEALNEHLNIKDKLHLPKEALVPWYHTLSWLGYLQREMGQPHKQRTACEKALEIAKRCFEREDPHFATSLSNLGEICRVLGDFQNAIEYHQQALQLWKKNYGDEHQDVARSLNGLGMIFNALGDFQNAIEYHQQALQLWKKIYGDGHPNVGISLNNLGTVFYALGNISDAGKCFEQALHLWKKKYGDEHQDVARSLNNLGVIFRALKDYPKAKNFHETALSLRKKIYHDEHTDVAESLHNLGTILYDLGEYPKAREYLEQAVSLRKKIYGERHPDVAQSLNNLGGVFRALGNLHKAKEYHEQALNLQKKIYDDEHHEIAISLKNLGEVFHALGDNNKTIEHLNRALHIQEKLFGSDHNETKATQSRLSKIIGDEKCDPLADQKLLTENLKQNSNPHLFKSHKNLLNRKIKRLSLLSAALEKCKTKNDGLELPEPELALIRASTNGHLDLVKVIVENVEDLNINQYIAERYLELDHPNVAISLNNLGEVFRNLGDFNKAREYFEHALPLWKKIYGDKHPGVVISINNLGVVFRVLGNLHKARKYHKQALNLGKEIHGNEHPNVAVSLNNLGEVCRALGNFHKAKEYHEQALDLQKKIYGDKHPEIAISLNNLGEDFRALGDYPNAKEYHEQALNLGKEIHGNEHPNIAISLNNLGMVFLALGNLHKAQEYHEQSLSLFEKTHGNEHLNVAISLKNLGLVFHAFGNNNKAIEYIKHALQIQEKLFGINHAKTRATKLTLLKISGDKSRKKSAGQKNSTKAVEQNSELLLFKSHKNLLNRKIKNLSLLIVALEKCKYKIDGLELPEPELALRRASGIGQLRVVKVIVENVEDLNINQHDVSGKNAIMYAMKSKRSSIIEFLQKFGGKVNTENLEINSLKQKSKCVIQ